MTFDYVENVLSVFDIALEGGGKQTSELPATTSRKTKISGKRAADKKRPERKTPGRKRT